MQRITPQTNRRLHLLLNQSKLMEYKKELVQHYSGVEATSSKDLLEHEAKALCKHLESTLSSPKNTHRPSGTSLEGGSPPRTEEEMRCDTMRKKIIYYAHLMGWEITSPAPPSSSPRGGGLPKRKADMERINHWCVSKGMYGKRLDAHSIEELPHLVSQFEIVYRKHLQNQRANERV